MRVVILSRSGLFEVQLLTREVHSTGHCCRCRMWYNHLRLLLQAEKKFGLNESLRQDIALQAAVQQ